MVPNGYNILPGGQKSRKLSVKKCTKCGKEIKDSSSGLCRSCVQIKFEPSKEELFSILKENQGNFTKVGNFYNVTANAIKKRCKKLNLPYLSADYKVKQEVIKKSKTKPVVKIHPDTLEELETFNSIAEAARSLNLKKGSHITEACKDGNKIAYGFRWKYL